MHYSYRSHKTQNISLKPKITLIFTGPNVINKLQQPELQLETTTFTSLEDAIEKFRNKWMPTTAPSLTADCIDIIKHEL